MAYIRVRRSDRRRLKLISNPTNFILYLAQCTATGKVYVGCTTKTLQHRKAQHVDSAANGSPYKFHKALKEFGPDSFRWSVIGTAKSIAEMFQTERKLIARYNSYRNGLNSTPGGEGRPTDNKGPLGIGKINPYAKKRTTGTARYRS